MPSWLRKRPSVQAIAVFLAVAVVYVGTASYGGAESPFQSRDTLTTAIGAWALAVHHTVNIGAHLTPTGRATLWLVPGAHGTLVSNRFPGAVLLATPLYWLIGGGFRGIPAGLTASVATAGTATGVFVLLRRTYPLRVALGAVGLFAFATANWSVSAKELWEHSGAELFIVLGMLAFARRSWLLAGLCFGGTIMFRPHLGVGVAVLALGVLWMERRVAPFVKFSAAATVGLAGYLCWNSVLYGHFTLLGGYSDQVSGGGVGVLDFFDNLAGTFVSPERGLLICSPVLLLAVAGAKAGWTRSSRPERVWAAAGLAYLVSQLWLIRFSGGSGFLGYRTCLEGLVWVFPLIVRCGMAGMGKVPAYLSVGLAAVSVAFFSCGMFLPNEVWGTYNPWASYGPFELASGFGPGKVLIGALIGAAGTVAVWASLSGRFQRRPVVIAVKDRQPDTPLVSEAQLATS